ncbi:TIGR02391 family protein [Pedobacter sp. HMF7647]|uniref:TIGR02391 family protein n=1 Tax=Hufsiella arboris TaxID=2695275 RepID=A0A7K1YE83_9SPHI|nr:TIGR02391 family protein [Hufsiella arboris]MXV52671.1 TIGR02391 family protein [Hufsiella arboris]
MTIQASIPGPVLEAICDIIADTNNGLTGSEIGHILVNSGINDVDPLNSKRRRLFNAFAGWQNQHQCSNHILKFIQYALQPARYIGNKELHRSRLFEVNKRLSFLGMELLETGKYRMVEKTQTISEDEQRAGRFKEKLELRNSHAFIFKYCLPELLVDNYFHAVFEATKSVADRLRAMTGLYADGNALAETIFSTDKPLIRINLMQNATDRSEHIGLCNLIKGMFGVIRNATAHEPKLTFVIDEEAALDMMNVVSFIHKRLDQAI